MGTLDPQASTPATPPTRPGIIASWLAHRREMALIHAQLAQERLQDRAEARKQKEQAKSAKAAQPRPPSLLTRVFNHTAAQRTVERQNVRHAIQAAGHEYLALILMLAAAGGSLLFFLGRYYGNGAPLYIVIPAAVLLALSIEWSTLVFGQDMQDSLTLHQPAMFLVNLVKAVIAYGVSVFMMANAASVVWAPLDNLLGIDTKTWAWALAITIFGVQFLLKLSPERPKAAKNIVAVSHFVAMMAPEATPEQQILMASRMLAAFASPAPIAQVEAPREMRILSASSQTLPPSTSPHPLLNEQPVVPEKLQLTIEALTANPDITDEELTEYLGLKKIASRGYWRLKALDFLAAQQEPQEPALRVNQRKQTFSAALLGNHHQVIVPREPLSPVYITSNESEGSDDGTNSFRR
jgi:hypothetical protein